MPEYLAPGVYVEEIERGPKPIEGVATSTAAFLGATERGPSRPRLVTSYSEYLRYFGDIFSDAAYMPYAVRAFFDNGGRRAYIARISGVDAARATASVAGFSFRATGVGSAYNRVWARIDEATTKGPNQQALGFRLRVWYWDKAAPNVPYDVHAAIGAGGDLPGPLPSATEDFDDLSLDPASPSYFLKRVNGTNPVAGGNSSFVEFVDGAAGPAAVAGIAGSDQLDNGADDDALTVPDFEGVQADPNQCTGLAALALDRYRDVAIVHAPAAPEPVAKAVVTHCERSRFRFAVVDVQSDQGVSDALEPRDSVQDSQYAAFYYPWIFVSDPRSGARKKIPPGGAVCGIYALTDNTTGVWKAPANEVVAGAIDVEYEITTRAQEALNPRGVNAIRRFPGRGIRVWGARTLSSDPLWKYINVRRLFIFLEASIYYSTQWAVFEPNDPRLWARVKQTITLFLRTQWREGALFGEKEEQAFRVSVGRDTMTEDDILNGRLIVEIGIAPVRPAEFVIFRVYQQTQEAMTGAS
jgi:phage tail sheath protein FI